MAKNVEWAFEIPIRWEILLRAPCKRIESKNREYPYLKLEEKLANAYMLKRINSRTNIRADSHAKRGCLEEPPGYKDGPGAVKAEDFEYGLAELTKHYVGLHAAEQGRNILASVVDLPKLYPTTDDPRFFASCPVYRIRDGKTIGLPPNAPALIAVIPNILESKRFKKRLGKLGNDIQNAWKQVKIKLAQRVPNAPEFEKMREKEFEGLWSIRVTRGKGAAIRAHLRPTDKYATWEAVDIGRLHKGSGHG